jgi:multimeric flavodoxin WrbA
MAIQAERRVKTEMSEDLKVLGISASPRHGNSEFLLDHAMDEVAKLDLGPRILVEKYSFAGKKFSPCIGCFACGKNGGHCVIEDSFQELQPRWFAADAIVYAVPVYVMNIPGQLKCFFDRLCNSQYGDKENSLKRLNVAAMISQGGSHSAGQESALKELIAYTVLTGGLPVAAGTRNSYTGVRGWTNHNLGTDALANRFQEADDEVVELVKQARDLASQAAIAALIVKKGALAMRDELRSRAEYRSLIRRIEGGGAPS